MRTGQKVELNQIGTKKMDLESNRPTLLKLCWLISQQWKAELAYSRAQYRVSYYRKLKAKLENSRTSNEKWSDHLELTKKIEQERLYCLKKQGQLVSTKKRLCGPIAVARKKLNALIVFKEGKVIALQLTIKSGLKGIDTYVDVSAQQIAEMADQYEAEKALNKALSK